jgi:hypothetical protein
LTDHKIAFSFLDFLSHFFEINETKNMKGKEKEGKEGGNLE